jgi:hypothetical protein
MAKNREIQKVQGSSICTTLDDSSVAISKSNCKFCQSKFRKEAEALYEKYSNITAVHKFFTDEKKEDVSYLAIRNHIHKHYFGELRLMSVKEWAEDVDRFSAGKFDQRKMLLERIAIMRREMCLIAADTDSVDLKERRISSDAIKKLSDGIGACEEKLEKVDKEYEQIEIVIENLKNILANKINKTDSEAVKRVLMEVLQELADNLSELLTPSGIE